MVRLIVGSTGHKSKKRNLILFHTPNTILYRVHLTITVVIVVMQTAALQVDFNRIQKLSLRVNYCNNITTDSYAYFKQDTELSHSTLC